MIVLGIESSCDETGIALFDTEKGALAHHVHSQIQLHRQYGGVVPELASRDHINRTLPLIEKTLDDAHLKKNDIDAIAYTAGPGLLGALLCGSSIAQSLAFSLNIPSIRIHHMEGHLLAALLDENTPPPSLPFVALLVSGGHTMLVLVKQLGDYQVLGETLDDAVGEAFDKTAKLMGLPYPGGPELAELAETGNPTAFDLPRPMTNRPGLDFSFSGLKTQVRLLIEDNPPHNKADIAASFQNAVVNTLLIKCRRALQTTGAKSLVISGGVSANKQLRKKLSQYCTTNTISIHLPPMHLCTDNGLMIAHAGALRFNQRTKSYTIDCTARWQLDTLLAI
ncbi:MAG: tRNA (adenosine(37)-N6)-threonylcarbamoyltransferase complex transferase subunit TsaD [Ostreibacterium sp.]